MAWESCAPSPAASTRPSSPTTASSTRFVALAQRATVPVELDTALPERLPVAIQAAASFRGRRQALTNVVTLRRGQPSPGVRG